jgi:esterase/lipase superfamily enzyme
MRYWAALGFSAGLLAALLSACSRELLAPTPDVFTAPQNRPPVDDAQPVNSSGDLKLLYVTDRAPASDPRTTALSYGSERSRTMSFGSIDIRIEPESSGRGET